MSRRLCCCGRQPKPEAFCCNPEFYKDFITLYGDSMAQHAEVSPKDWIALYVERPGNGSGNSWTLSHLPSSSAPYTCNCNSNEIPGCGKDNCDCVSENYYSVPNFDPNDPQDVEALELGRRSCCQLHRLISTTDGAKPMYFAYKYSGCNLIWYPREFAFNYDPYIVQCNGFITRRILTDTNRVVQNSCHNWATQENAGAAGDQIPSACEDPQTVGYDEILPCACSPHPHIHGGIYDSLYNRVNVKLSPYSLGYLPFMLPFSRPMTVDEAGCCWCANTSSTNANFEAFRKGRQACFLKGYPFSDAAGKTISISNVCGPGFDCTAERSGVISSNQRYRRACFERGISPYLLRLSKEEHKMAYEIWGHGANASTVNDYGASYNVRSIEIKKLQKDIVVEFRKAIGQKTKLRDQFIGTIHLEHHFEMYAYRSDDASASIEIQALQNNCTALVSPYEGHGGIISKRGSYNRWTPWKFDSIMWQVRRAIPRRVMYKGSGVPLFQFDLINMETISFQKNIRHNGDNFDGALFLSHYYRYFYGLIYFNTGACEYIGDDPVAPEWDFSHYLDSYDYVRFWLEEMIVNGVIKIKDHAVDIANEVNDIIASGNETPSGTLEIAEEVLLKVGGTEGYRNLINFFGVPAGAQNAVTPKIIKQKLLNPEGTSTWRGPSGDYETFRAFLPRRAVLPAAETKAGVTAWGFTGDFARLQETIFGITGAPDLVSTAINDLPSIYNINDENSIFNEVLNPQRVVCGLMGAFIIDASGKLTLFGSDLENAPTGESPCEGFGSNWQPYVGCVPPYLLITNLFKEDEENPGQIIERSPEEIPDGRVIDVAFKRDFAVALVDFVQGGIAQNCAIGPGNDVDFTPAVEDSSTYDNDFGGPNANVNGNNEYMKFGGGNYCALDEPFHEGVENAAIPGGPRSAYERRKPNAYRLKSWGSKAKQYGTFCGSNAQADFDIPQECTVSKIEYLRYNSEVNPILDGGFSRRYPGTNNFFIWTALSSGVKHLAAIDDYGGIFITPQSDNSLNQSQKGLGVTYSSIYKQALETGADNPESFKCIDRHNGLGPRFNYYPHIPRPGYVKEEEWTQTFYNNITLPDTSYKKNICSCWFDWDTCGQGAGGGPGGGDSEVCAGPLYPLLDATNPISGCCSDPYPPEVLDLTCVLLGSLVQYPDSAEPWTPRENDAQPRYTKVACGLYNTLCLTNENKLEIYGSYVKVTPEGEPIIDENNPVIPAYVPDALKQKAGSWNVTYACPIYCAGTTHSPIIDYSYNEPSPNNVIEQIESSADYSICVTGDKKVHIWGDASMVPGAFDPNSYQPGTVAYRVLDTELTNITEIVSIAAGVNSIYIHYKKNIGVSTSGIPLRASVTYEFTRYNINGTSTEVPDEVQNSRIVDIGAGYLHAVVIYSKRLESKVWKAQDFAEGTLKYQFKDFAILPFFFRRQAFFHALPGGWDYSKWLYGGVCCSSLESPGTNPVRQPDPCAVLRYNIFNGENDEMLSYSGNPHYFWMRSDWRRATFQSTETVQILRGGFSNEPQSCRPDVGLQVTPGGSNFSFMSAVVGKCLNQLGLAWGSARPLKSQVRRDIRVPLAEECWKVPCSADNNVIFVNPLINSAGNLTAIGTEPPPRSGYKSTKDLFQKMTIYYGDYAPSSNSLQVCPIAKASAWSYFKYAERHYYFGYDETKDVWDIYENPDFLRETSETPFVFDDQDQATSFGVGGCTLYGFGGGTGPNGGACAGCCGYYSLYEYPLTGPNYGIENVTETPIVLTDTFVQRLVNLALGPNSGTSETGPVCDSCFVGIQVQNIQRYLGPGGFMFKGDRVLDNVITNSIGEIIGTKPLAPMAYSHIYNRTIRRTQYVKNMLLGVGTNLATSTIPPSQSNTDYEKKSFSDVLGDPLLTEQYTPWRYGSSTKWIPICWRTPFVIPNSNQNSLSSKDLYFNYSIDQGDNRKQVDDDPIKNSIFREVEYSVSSIPIFGNDTGDFNENIRLIQEFITDPNYPGLVSLQKGVFEFFIQCKSKYATNPIYFFARVNKLKTNGEVQLITETLIDTVVNPAGDFTSPTDTGQEGAPTQGDYIELRLHSYFDQNIPMDEEDRLLVQFFIKGGDPNTVAEIGDSIFIKYEDSTPYTFRNEDTGDIIPLEITKYSRMQYTHVSEDINQACFGGFTETDPPNVIRATNVDPNIVILRLPGPIIVGPPVICGVLPCCGE